VEAKDLKAYGLPIIGKDSRAEKASR